MEWEQWYPHDEDRQKIRTAMGKAEEEGWADRIITRSDMEAIRQGMWFSQKMADRFTSFAEQLQLNTGQWARRKLILFPWQKEKITEPLYGWLRRNEYGDIVRRFRQAYVSLPKKSGKSTLAAAIHLYHFLADNEASAICIVGAVDRYQAQIVHGEAIKMIESSAIFEKALQRGEIQVYPSTHRIVHKPSYSYLSTASKQVSNLDGISISCAHIDELHLAKTGELYDMLKFAGSARSQPIFLITSTAGWDMDSICGRECTYARQILSNEIVATNYLACIYEAPIDADISDPDVWMAANPTLGTTISMESFREDYEQAKSMGKLAAWRRRRLNQWVQNTDNWIPIRLWDNCAAEDFDLNTLRDLPYYAGLDLADTSDFNALVIVFHDESDGIIYVKPKFWIPEQTIPDRVKKSFVPYDQWVSEGWMTITPGSVSDYGFIEQEILEHHHNFPGMKALGTDPWGAHYLSSRLLAQGVPVVRVPQSLNNLSEPLKWLERLIKSEKVVHDGNKVMRFCVKNTVIYEDPRKNIMADKKRSQDKIDGVAALITAMALIAQTYDAEEIDFSPDDPGLVIL